MRLHTSRDAAVAYRNRMVIHPRTLPSVRKRLEQLNPKTLIVQDVADVSKTTPEALKPFCDVCHKRSDVVVIVGECENAIGLCRSCVDAAHDLIHQEEGRA